MSFFKGDQKADKIQQLCDYIDRSNAIVATTGAGISIAGGGVTYGQMHFAGMRGGGYGSDSFMKSFRDSMFNYEPSFSHYALRDLEEEGKLIGVITTNVDCMHTKAGSKNVAEIQGSFQVNCCASCGRHYDGYDIWNQEELPRCTVCGGSIQPWPIYSHIGLWDEDVNKAREWIGKADLILAIGTHGNYGGVYWSYRRRDAVVVQINPGRTAFDMEAALNIREECDAVFRQVKERRG
ncbi:MAG: hypothetical protein LUI02_06210 [Clostridiales bacterium]|nr:hypothetical protein [Clostridiales bacterium]